MVAQRVYHVTLIICVYFNGSVFSNYNIIIVVSPSILQSADREMIQFSGSYLNQACLFSPDGSRVNTQLIHKVPGVFQDLTGSRGHSA